MAVFRFRRWWLLCGAVLVGVVALNGVVDGVVDAKVRPAPRTVCVRGGATATDAVSGRGLVCVRTRVRGLRWRFRPAAVTTTTTTTTSPSTTTTVPGVVAPALVSVSASDGVQITVAGMRPDTGVYSLQWVLQGSTFNTYQMARATSPSMNVPAGWFACNRTYTFRVFVMQADWQLADGHQTQNVTHHSTPFDVVMPACTTPTTTPTTTPPGVALTPSFGTPTSTADGFTVQISNYDALFTWAGTASASGVVVISGSGLVTVSGVAARTSSTATITTERSGYSGGSATVTAASQCDPGVVCVVGDTGPGGGIVFYVSATDFTSTGSDCGTTCKYLEAAPADQSSGIVWATITPKCYVEAGGDGSNNNSCQSFSIYSPHDTPNQADSRTAATAIGKGMANTNQVHSRLTFEGAAATDTYAAGIAFAYANNSKTDWHLPSKDELNELCKYARTQTTGDSSTTCNNTGSLTGSWSNQYWSSSEINTNHALRQLFNTDGNQGNGFKGGTANAVRPVRAFG